MQGQNANILSRGCSAFYEAFWKCVYLGWHDCDGTTTVSGLGPGILNTRQRRKSPGQPRIVPLPMQLSNDVQDENVLSLEPNWVLNIPQHILSGMVLIITPFSRNAITVEKWGKTVSEFHLELYQELFTISGNYIIHTNATCSIWVTIIAKLYQSSSAAVTFLVFLHRDINSWLLHCLLSSHASAFTNWTKYFILSYFLLYITFRALYIYFFSLNVLWMSLQDS